VLLVFPKLFGYCLWTVTCFSFAPFTLFPKGFKFNPEDLIWDMFYDLLFPKTPGFDASGSGFALNLFDESAFYSDGFLSMKSE
jgi:hypothetical protein